MKNSILVVAALMIAFSSCVKHVDTRAWATLAMVEDLDYELTSVTWEEDFPIQCTQEIEESGYDILAQIKKCANYSAAISPYKYLSTKELHTGKAAYDKDARLYKGSITAMYIAYSHGTIKLEDNPKPSEYESPIVLFGICFAIIPYTVSEDGTFSADTYLASTFYDKTTSQMNHISCYLESIEDGKVVIIFPEFITPDFATDKYYVGKVKMVYSKP